jgi:hypothetical protein
MSYEKKKLKINFFIYFYIFKLNYIFFSFLKRNFLLIKFMNIILMLLIINKIKESIF